MSSELLRYLGDTIREAERQADRIYEVVIGLVVDNCDPERLGRVKLRFPTLPGQDTSYWAQIASLGAGKDRGWWFLPEINDEVLVAFEHGDIGRPIVLGALWNGVDTPPSSGTGKRLLRSRNGSQVVFDDVAGTVTVEDGKQVGRIVLDKAGTITLEALQGDVELQATQGTLSVAAKTIVLTASQKILLHSNGPVSVAAASSTIRARNRFSASASTLHLNPPGGSAAAEVATARSEPVADPVSGAGGPAGPATAPPAARSAASSPAAAPPERRPATQRIMPTGLDAPPVSSPDEPIEDSPDEPIEDLPDEPIEDSPDEPIEDSPDEPIEDSPDEPSESGAELPGNIARSLKAGIPTPRKLGDKLRGDAQAKARSGLESAMRPKPAGGGDVAADLPGDPDDIDDL